MKIQYKPGRMANQKYQNIAHHDCRQAVFRSGVIFLLLGFAHFHGRRWSDSNGSGLGTVTFTWWGHCRGRYCIRSRSFNFYVVTRGKLIVFCKEKEIVVWTQCCQLSKYETRNDFRTCRKNGLRIFIVKAACLLAFRTFWTGITTGGAWWSLAFGWFRRCGLFRFVGLMLTAIGTFDIWWAAHLRLGMVQFISRFQWAGFLL